MVENFDVKEAATVIRECAAQDKIAFDPELPELMAEDLAIEGRVRPADLQIVCFALSGDLTIDRYKREGRAAGLRSRFIKSVIEITGDPVLARAVLRELCDIPNNKKMPEPLSAEEIAEKARAGAPGQRATNEAVTAVLLALEQALVVVNVDSPDGPRWSLIHDYLVEPIKLATEEQTTRSEAAVARLDYFVARAKTTPQIIIPLAELRSIKQDAPPAAVRQPAARALIRRSLLVGYGKPVGAASAAALASVIIVVAFATERGWRVNDERNHWNEGARDRQPVEANLTDLHARPGRRSAVVMDRFSRLSERVSIWDADSGELVAVQTGRLRIVDGWLWHQDRSLNHLSRRDIAGSEVSRITLSADGRPAALNQIQFSMLTEDLSISDEQYVNIEGSFGHLATFDYKNNKWYTKAQSDFKPEGEEGSSWRSRSGKRLFALIVENSKTRLTIFNRNTYETLISEDTSDKLHLVGITDLPNRTIISLIKTGKLELISIPIRKI